MNVDSTLAWQRDMWRSMGMPEAAIDRHFSPGGLPYYRIHYQAGLISDDEMELIEALWPTWGGDGRDLVKLVRNLLA